MSEPIPCPSCGSDIGPNDQGCSICGHAVGAGRNSNSGAPKCGRCGAMMPAGFDFCPICGQDQRGRLWRPPTQEIHIRGVAMPPAPGGAPAASSAAPAAQPAAPLPGSADRTVPAPSGGQPVMAPFAGMTPGAASTPNFPPPPSPGGGASRTVIAPPEQRGGGRKQGDLIAAVADANTMEPPGGMPAVQAPAAGDRTQGAGASGPTPAAPTPAPAPASDDAHTVPHSPRHHLPAQSAAGEDDRTRPHPQMQRPVAISPVRASSTPATRPDRPGGFSGGPGHGPLPTVNRAQRNTLQPDPGAAHNVGAGPNAGPRLVLVARDGSEGEAFPIPDGPMTIGRTHGDLLFPEDPFLSPMHVRIQQTGERMGLFDTGSTNGVYLRIRGSAPVYPGDQFMIGHQLLRLENIDTQVQERPPAIDGTRVFGTPLQPAWGCVRQVGRGGIVGDKYYLRGSQVVFGREGGDLLFPNDPFVSREHARLRLELHGQSMAVFLEDLESANGTYIRIRGSAEMNHLDTFRIGDQILRLRVD